MKTHPKITGLFVIFLLLIAFPSYSQTTSGWSSNIVKGSRMCTYRFMYMSMDEFSMQMHMGMYQGAISDNLAWFGLGGLVLTSWEQTTLEFDLDNYQFNERKETNTESGILFGGGFLHELVEGSVTNEYGETELKSLSVALHAMAFGADMYGFSILVPMGGAIAELPLIGEMVIAQGNLSIAFLGDIYPAFGGDIIIRPLSNYPQLKFTLGGLISELSREEDDDSGGKKPFTLNFGITYEFRKF